MKKQKKSKFLVFMSIILILGGLSLTGYSIINALNYWEKSIKYDSTEAKVTGHKYDNKGYVAIIVEYEVGEVTYTIEDDNYVKKPVRKSRSINVKYDPQNPEDVIIDKDLEHFRLHATGMLFFIGGIILSIISKKTKTFKTTNVIPENKQIETPNQPEKKLEETFSIDLPPKPIEKTLEKTPKETSEEIEVFSI